MMNTTLLSDQYCDIMENEEVTETNKVEKSAKKRPAKNWRVESSRLSGVHGHGLGIGEIKFDLGEEQNGCDRCGCPDEQRCCPGFWNDRGVPPIWPLSWVFDPKNKYLNDNRYARMFGNFGFKFFDKERKAFMGTALAVTIVSIFVTMYSLVTLSPNASLLHATAWGIASYRYDTDDGKVGQVNYIGLQKFAVMTCENAEDSNYLNWNHCNMEGVWWSAVKCESGEEDFYGFPCGPIGECGETSTNNQFGAIMTCVTLIFAMIGCLTRMRKVADTNFQKMIGCFPDTLGIITQLQALSIFAADCYDNMPVRSTTGDTIHYRVGVGYWAFVVCWLAAIIRASVHYCTPVPGGGVGCRFEDMKVAASEMNNLMGDVQANLMTGIQEVHTGVKSGLQEVHTGVKSGLQEVHTGVKSGLHEVHTNVRSGIQETVNVLRKNTGAPRPDINLDTTPGVAPDDRGLDL